MATVETIEPRKYCGDARQTVDFRTTYDDCKVKIEQPDDLEIEDDSSMEEDIAETAAVIPDTGGYTSSGRWRCRHG